ncbi:MAG: ferrochelatase [Chloroflexota bacterium]
MTKPMTILDSEQTNTYDALLIVSFGGPEGMDDVIPFLENVLRGRNVPRERLVEVSRHYALFDGVSPINAQNRALIKALEVELAEHGPTLPIYWGNRNWHPMLEQTMEQMKEDGIKKVLTFFTSMFSSYSGCRQYREDLYRTSQVVAPYTFDFDKIRMAYNHPGYIQPNVENVQAAFEQIPSARREDVHLAFTAHSLPMGMAANCAYEAQLAESSQLVAEEVGVKNWQLVYQSRSGPPQQPWLEPDICDHLEVLHAQGVEDVVILPIGFISDHMEVIYDLDTEAKELCQSLGLNMIRAATVGTHPRFVQMIRELIVERTSDSPNRLVLGTRGANHDICGPNCCLSGRPGEPKPTVAQLPSMLAKQ